MPATETNKPIISEDGKKMTITSPNENFILTVYGLQGTIIISRANSRNENPIVLEETYTMDREADSINMVGFPYGCKITLITTGKFFDANVDCGRV